MRLDFLENFFVRFEPRNVWLGFQDNDRYLEYLHIADALFSKANEVLQFQSAQKSASVFTEPSEHLTFCPVELVGAPSGLTL